MALVLKDRVKESSVSTGTGAFVLDGAVGPFQAFSTIGDGNETYYAIVGQTTTEWEVGIGTYTTSTDSISRDTILASANSNTIVTFSAGTKDVFITYPSEKAIYEEPDGDTLINAGPITVIGAGVTSIPSLPAELGKFIGDVNSFAQIYTLNQNDGSTASADVITYNDLTTDGYTYFTDMGISSSNYTSVDYPIFTPNSGYVFHQGGDFFIGIQTSNKDIKLFSGGVDVTDLVATFSGTDRSASFEADVNVGGAIDVTGAATFGSTVLLDADPTLALQAATKQYVDNQVTAGLHIHDPVRVETTGNLNATYTGGGTNANIIQIANGTDITFFSVTPSVGDQFYIGSSSNGLLANTAYFIVNDLGGNTYQASLTFGGAIVTGLTNGSPTIPSVINSGVGAYLTNAGTQAALTIDSVALSVGNRVMVRLQTNGAHNGVYEVTTVGSGSTNWVITRTADASIVSPSDPNGLGTGDYFYTQEGTLNAGDSHVLTTEPNTMIIGYTALTYTQFSGSVDYVGGTNINITGQTISLTGTVAATNGGTGTSTVTTGDLLYGSASNTWSKLPVGSAYRSLVVNSGGTQVEWNAVALDQAGAISGSLGATNGGTGQSAYTLGDTLYSSATNTIAKLAGNTSTTKQYLSQTGTGSASAAPSWATISAADIGAGTLPATRGGTDNSSYAVGDILYANTTTSLAKLADVATGNVLISGGVSAAPAWGKVALASAVSGTLGLANGGTSATTQQGAINALAGAVTSGQYLRGNGTNVLMSAIQAADVPTLNQDTTGNAATATTATNFAGIPSGTVMLFIQTTAPTGWTKSVAHDNKALRIVSGTASSGGSVAFTTAFTSQGVTGSVGTSGSTTATNQATTAGGSVGDTGLATATNQATTAGGSVGVTVTAGTLAVGAGTFAVSATTLAESQIPSHVHSAYLYFYDSGSRTAFRGSVPNVQSGPVNTNATGGSGSHTHGLTGAPSLSGSPSVTGTSFTGTSHSHTQDAHNHTSGAFTGTSHNHTQDAHSHTGGAFTGNAINLAVQYVDAIIATKN